MSRSGAMGSSSGAQYLTPAAASGTYAPWSAARPGNAAVFLGDSITQSSDALTAHLGAWPVYASVMSAQRIQYVYNAGISGNTTADMLARFDTDVTAHNPQVVFLLGGTNDIAGTLLTTTQANIKTLVSKIRTIGAVPVLGTIPPNGTTSPADRKERTTQLNTWIRRYAAQQGLICLDFYALLTDPATGAYLASYDSGDHIHPTESGYAAMGSLANSQVGPLLPISTPGALCWDDNDENNLLVNGTFSGASGTALPSPWFDNAGTPAGSAVSYTTDSQVPGKFLTITSTATAAVRQMAYDMNLGATTMPAVNAGDTTFNLSVNPYTRGVLFIGSGNTFEIAKVASVTGSGPYAVTLTRGLAHAHAAGEAVVVNGQPGDVMALSARLTTDGGVYGKVAIQPTGGGSGVTAAQLAKAVTRGVAYVEFTIAAGTTTLEPRLEVGSGTGVVSFGQVGLYNLTRMGVL